jgi:hypothetical protein
MKKSEILERYFELFYLTVEDPRIRPKSMAKQIRYSGRGRSPKTLYCQLEKMYSNRISMKPQITLKSFDSAQITTYLCKRGASRGLYSMFRKIDQDTEVSYAMCLTSCDFFLTSRNDDLRVDKFGLELVWKSKLFTPIYPIPSGLQLDMERAFENFLDSNFEKGKIGRMLHKQLDWEPLDWKIYQSMRLDIRRDFTKVAKDVGVTSKTVQKRFYEKVLPKCIQINYFFPRGYHNYLKAFLLVNSNYENRITSALRKLPCTTYVFPLEESLVIILFHESVTMTLEFLEKIEEKAIIDSYLLYSVLSSSEQTND